MYSNSEWLVSRSFSKQNMRSLRFTRVILCRVNCLVVPTPELPGTAALEPDPWEAQEQVNQSMPESTAKLYCTEKMCDLKTLHSQVLL